MSKIHNLDPAVANAIAAGEVVERPASVIKELIENALDAGASSIIIEIENGGIKMMRVTDDGIGMDKDDALKAFECHATSKVSTLDDLNALSTMGFRGEALSSIGAVSRVVLKTSPKQEKTGSQVEVEAGKITKTENCAAIQGTQIGVYDLFSNQPARYKFLKKDHTEAQHIIVLCERFVLIRPDVSFRLIKNGKTILQSPGNSDYKDALYCVYGSKVVDHCHEVYHDHDKIHVRGFAGSAAISRAGRSEQTVFVNDRLIRSKTVSAAIDQAYRPYLMKGKHAFVVLYLTLPPGLVDVNVHPQKSEVRFWNDSEIFRAVYHSIHNALNQQTTATSIPSLDEKNNKSKSDLNTPPLMDNQTTSVEATVKSPNESIDQSIEISKDWQVDPNNDQTTTAKVPQPLSVSEQLRIDMPSDSFFDKSNKMSARDQSLAEIADAHVIGVLFSTYILMQTKKSFFLLDQHAAHEKILFESLMQKHSENKSDPVASQSLIMPEIISLSRSDMLFLEEHSEKLHLLGFDFSSMGQTDVAVRAIPSCAQNGEVRTLFLTLLDQLQSNVPISDRDTYQQLATAACKAAIKANDRLDDQEIFELISRLIQLEEPFHCPHGRPIVIRYNIEDIEKWFKRIV